VLEKGEKWGLRMEGKREKIKQKRGPLPTKKDM
jgi:hypothetical protein